MCQFYKQTHRSPKSRCLSIRVPSPSTQEIVTVLNNVAKKEGMTLPEPFALRIANGSDRNLRRALLMLEAARVQQYPFHVDQQLPLPDWENYVSLIARDICSDQSPKQILDTRSKLYELLANCIPPDVIIKTLAQHLTHNLDSSLKCQVAKWAAHYEHSCKLGSKPIFHLEAFVCKFMHIYRKAMASV
eukprot:NODE_7038_length_817_cov_41.085014_g6435_i0.p1 GENE.NODE_7038_length_817_cov_41.085014_g6435_i0~~NODE_7038_length_817_cov_41.085014_g6435_i0.p1  ORF type:complete len:188 (+),score=27.31 NODE_7038_length_817_cov_41.085014_g6435_i0:149-712(+)